jgi:hypothetical protein
MGNDVQPINYDAVLADLKSRKAELEAAITAIEKITGQVSGSTPPSGGTGPHAFLGMSIPEATKAHLAATRRKQSTQDIMTALEAGGLPPSKYSTVYAVLRRREAQVGDIINMKGDWALSEWYPGYKRAKAKADLDEAVEESNNIQSSPEEVEARAKAMGLKTQAS